MAGALQLFAAIDVAKGHHAEAEPSLRRALAIHERARDPVPLGLSDSLEYLATWHVGEGHYADAETQQRRALALTEKTLGPDAIQVAGRLNALAWVLCERGRYDEAEALAQRSLAIREKILGKDNDVVAGSLWTLARIDLRCKRHAEAEPLARRCLEIREKTQGESHSSVATALALLAHILGGEGKADEALTLSDRALHIFTKTRGEAHRDTAGALDARVLSLLGLDRAKEAEAPARQALAIARSLFPATIRTSPSPPRGLFPCSARPAGRRRRRRSRPGRRRRGSIRGRPSPIDAVRYDSASRPPIRRGMRLRQPPKIGPSLASRLRDSESDGCRYKDDPFRNRVRSRGGGARRVSAIRRSPGWPRTRPIRPSTQIRSRRQARGVWLSLRVPPPNNEVGPRKLDHVVLRNPHNAQYNPISDFPGLGSIKKMCKRGKICRRGDMGYALSRGRRPNPRFRPLFTHL